MLKIAILPLVLLGLLAACTPNTKQKLSQDTRQVGTFANDTFITSDIKANLFAQSAFKTFHIHVKTVDGIVTLHGVVPTEQLRQQAVTTAKEVKGVKGVIDNIEVNKRQ